MTEKEFLYDKEIDCPCCKTKFITQKVRFSRLRMLNKDEDLLVYYKDVNPLKYGVQVCPRCGYAASESKYKSIKKTEVPIVLKSITAAWEPRDLGGLRTINQAIDTYKLALLQGNMLNYDSIDIGNLCLSIGWLYRGKDNEEEMRFLRLARNEFIKEYENGPSIGSDITKLTYMIGELSRRIGDMEEAKKWIAISIELPEMKLNPILNRLARDQWFIVKNAGESKLT